MVRGENWPTSGQGEGIRALEKGERKAGRSGKSKGWEIHVGKGTYGGAEGEKAG